MQELLSPYGLRSNLTGIGSSIGNHSIDLQTVAETERYRDRAGAAVKAVSIRGAAEAGDRAVEPIHSRQRLRGLRILRLRKAIPRNGR